jgi:hypothetical protein
MLGRLVGHPELGSIGRQAGDDSSIGSIDTIQGFRAESGLVKLNCLRASPD